MGLIKDRLDRLEGELLGGVDAAPEGADVVDLVGTAPSERSGEAAQPQVGEVIVSSPSSPKKVTWSGRWKGKRVDAPDWAVPNPSSATKDNQDSEQETTESEKNSITGKKEKEPRGLFSSFGLRAHPKASDSAAGRWV